MQAESRRVLARARRASAAGQGERERPDSPSREPPIGPSGLAAAALVLISVGGYFYHREKLAAIAAEHLRLVVTGPSTIQAGVDTEYLVSTTAIDGQPLPAKVEVCAVDARRQAAEGVQARRPTSMAACRLPFPPI